MLNLTNSIIAAGYIGITLIVFAESGLFIGFFLPGDSLLFTAGFFASQGKLNIWLLVALSIAAAIIGDSVGYWAGKKYGPALFNREDSLLFKKRYVIKTHEFFEKYGPKTIILARFLPVVRTFAPILAGVGEMRYRTFFTYNIIGGVLWAAGLSLLGFFLGSVIPDIDRYLLPVIVLIVVISTLPSAYHVLKDKENRDAIKTGLKKLRNRQ